MKDISTQIRIGAAVVLWSLLLMFGISMSSAVQAQLRPYRISDRQISDLLRRLDQDSGRFRNSLDSSLDRSRRDGTRAEDNINAFVRDFDNSVGHLRNQFNGRRSVAGDVEDVLQKAATIDEFMMRSRATSGAMGDWSAVKRDLDELANDYGVSWQWNRRVNDDYSNRGYGRRTGRNWDNYGNYGGSFDLRQTALNAGYNEGLKDGTEARQRGRSIDFSSQSAYRSATKDYSSRLGDRSLYQRYFREGYETGFNDAYNPALNIDNNVNNQDTWNRNNRRGRNWDRYGNYGGSFDLRQTALNAGYNEGIKEGRKDRGRGGYDFRNNSAYRDATTDYSSRLGDRELYRRYYREGYENGYNDGLNGN